MEVVGVLVTLAALLRVAAPLAGAQMLVMTWVAGAAWCGAFGLFACFYGDALLRARK